VQRNIIWPFLKSFQHAEHPLNTEVLYFGSAIPATRVTWVDVGGRGQVVQKKAFEERWADSDGTRPIPQAVQRVAVTSSTLVFPC